MFNYDGPYPDDSSDQKRGHLSSYSAFSALSVSVSGMSSQLDDLRESFLSSSGDRDSEMSNGVQHSRSSVDYDEELAANGRCSVERRMSQASRHSVGARSDYSGPGPGAGAGQGAGAGAGANAGVGAGAGDSIPFQSSLSGESNSHL